MITTLGLRPGGPDGQRLRAEGRRAWETATWSPARSSAGLVLLTFDMGPGKFPVRVTVDRLNGQVKSMEPVKQVVPNATEPGK